MNTLTLVQFLTTVRDHTIDTPEVLQAEGYHPKVIYAKAEKAARRGYIEYGTTPWRPWLTPKGQTFLEENP